MFVFQSLIGRLKTGFLIGGPIGALMFQSLIGRLKTPLYAELTTAMLRFQSLIGRLKTARSELIASMSAVSIPHR